jgi:hypothetical protein
MGQKEYLIKIDGKIDVADGFTAAWYEQHHTVVSLAYPHHTRIIEESNETFLLAGSARLWGILKPGA